MKLEELSPGHKIFVDIERGDYFFTLSSKILDMKDNNVLISEPFLEEGQIQKLKEKDIIHIRAFSGDGQSMYRWTCAKWVEVEDNGVGKLQLKLEKEGKLFNRREAFRLDLIHPVEAWSCSDGSFSAMMKDISILGLALESNKKLNFGDIVKVTLKQNAFSVEIVSKVVRKQEIKDTDSFVYGCSFIDTSTCLRKFINSKQLEYIRMSRAIK